MRQPLLRATPFALLALAGCVAPKAPAPPPSPPPAPAPVVTPALDWTDAPLTPGAWRWSAGSARFEDATGAPPLFALSCDTATRTIRFAARGAAGASASATLAFIASDGSFAYPASVGADGMIVARASAADPNLDRLAFSRGRFAVAAEAAGLRRTVLPARPELGRVIDDCRG